MIYLFGSLSNPNIVELTKHLRSEGHEVFSEWLSAGPEGDRHWKEYFANLGLSYKETLKTAFVETAFNFDLQHMLKADIGVLVMPAGRSGHLELGWMIGQGKRGYILYPDGEPERPDLMVKLATDIFFSADELVEALKLDTSANQLLKKCCTYFGLCTTCGEAHPSDCCPRFERDAWGV